MGEAKFLGFGNIVRGENDIDVKYTIFTAIGEIDAPEMYRRVKEKLLEGEKEDTIIEGLHIMLYDNVRQDLRDKIESGELDEEEGGK